MSRKQSEKSNTTVRILKRSTVPSISRRSRLLWEVGIDEKQNLQIRVVSNSGGGCFNSEFIDLKAIEAALAKVPEDEPVTSSVLAPIFRGFSENNLHFTWAFLLDAGYLAPAGTGKRSYTKTEPKAFKDEIRALIEGKTVPGAKEKKAQGRVAVKPGVATKTKKSLS